MEHFNSLHYVPQYYVNARTCSAGSFHTLNSIQGRPASYSLHVEFRFGIARKPLRRSDLSISLLITSYDRVEQISRVVEFFRADKT